MLGFPSDPPKTPLREMSAGLHRSQYRREPLEVEAFRSSQRMFFEERHHSPEQILATLEYIIQDRPLATLLLSAVVDGGTRWVSLTSYATFAAWFVLASRRVWPRYIGSPNTAR